MPDTKKRITDYPEAETLSDSDYVMVDNGGANGTKKFKAKNLGSGGSVELIVGNMQASFTTSTPSYILPNSQIGAWNDLPEGKHFADYDEIMLVVIFQMTPSDAQPQRYVTQSVPVWMLDTGNNLNDYGVEIAIVPNNTGARVAIRKDDKYNVEWYNYGSPIALLGIKY